MESNRGKLIVAIVLIGSAMGGLAAFIKNAKEIHAFFTELFHNRPAYEMASATDWIGVAAGAWFTCGLHKTGEIECWGLDKNNLARGPKGDYTAIYSGGENLCGVTGQESVCWGQNASGQNDPPLAPFIKLALGITHSCGLKSDGTITCWGSDALNLLDSPSTGRFIDLAAGSHHTCAIGEDGAITCWGHDSEDTLRAPAGKYKAISAGFLTTCATSETGSLRCWGYSAHGQASPPQDVSYTRVAISPHAGCGIQAATQYIECWGDERLAGLNADGRRNEFIDLAMGTLHVCGITTSHKMVCWGNNVQQQADPP